MNVRQLKNIMKEVNAPNEFILEPFDLEHPNYWIFRAKNVRLKTLFPKLETLRRENSRYDVFINGLFIRDIDYVNEQVVNDFHIKFIRTQFPEFDRFGNPYTIDGTDDVKIKGDLQQII